MNVTLNVINSYTKSFDIKIPAEDYDKQYQKSMKKVAKNISLPGFRRGKVPATLVKKQFHESIHGETIDSLVQKNFEKACDENKLYPLGNVQVTKLDFKDGEGIDYTVSFEVRPELGELNVTGFEIEKPVRKITDEDIEKTLENIQAQRSTVKELADDAEIQEGSFVVVDSQQLDEEKNPIEGKLYQNMSIEIGSGKFDKKIEKQLIGLKVGEEKFIEKKYPKNSKNKELAGTSEFFNFTINSIEERETPELNDEFAKSLNEDGVETLEQLRDKIKETLTQNFEHEARERFMDNVAAKIVEGNTIELPGSMVDNYLDRLYEQMTKQRGRAMSEERFKTARKESAEFEIRWQLIKEEIVEKNSLRVDVHTDEGKAAVKEFVESFPVPEEQKKMLLENHNYLHEASHQVEERRVIEFIESNNTINEKEIVPE